MRIQRVGTFVSQERIEALAGLQERLVVGVGRIPGRLRHLDTVVHEVPEHVDRLSASIDAHHHVPR